MIVVLGMPVMLVLGQVKVGLPLVNVQLGMIWPVLRPT
jgi:hypothetical protein